VIGWLADFLALITSTESLWKGIALVLMAVFGYQVYKELTNVRLELQQASTALIKNGKPISISTELTDLESSVKDDIDRIERLIGALFDTHENCSLNQAQCMKLQEEFKEKPWRFCEKFVDCPAVQTKNRLVQDVKNMLQAQLKLELDERKKQEEQFNAVFARAAEDRKRLEDLILENRNIITAFTQEFGAEVIKAVARDKREQNNVHRNK
jgi:hypothetical protein